MYPNGDSTADSEINLASQEQFDVLTDPFLTSWFDTTSTVEISDKCAGLFGTVNATDGHNIILNSHKYIVQEEWSNAVGGCSLTFPKTATVQVTLNPSGASNILSPSNFFPLTYAIGNQLFVVHYSSGIIAINADPNTSLSIGPMSSQSNPDLEEWCLDSSCLGVVVNLGNGAAPVSLVYYDILLQTVYEATSDNSLPTTFASISYVTAPKSASSASVPSTASYMLTTSAEGIWVERGTFASISPQSFIKTNNVERWFTPASNWTISHPLEIRSYYILSPVLDELFFSCIRGRNWTDGSFGELCQQRSPTILCR